MTCPSPSVMWSSTAAERSDAGGMMAVFIDFGYFEALGKQDMRERKRGREKTSLDALQKQPVHT